MHLVSLLAEIVSSTVLSSLAADFVCFSPLVQRLNIRRKESISAPMERNVNLFIKNPFRFDTSNYN